MSMFFSFDPASLHALQCLLRSEQPHFATLADEIENDGDRARKDEERNAIEVYNVWCEVQKNDQQGEKGN